MFYKHSTLWAFTLISGERSAHSACAQGRIDSLQHVEKFVITGRIDRKEVIPGQVLTGGQLHRLGSHHVAGALRNFSAIGIKDYGSAGRSKPVNIRNTGNHVGVSYDRIEPDNAPDGTATIPARLASSARAIY